jgi:hypothetical protein
LAVIGDNEIADAFVAADAVLANPKVIATALTTTVARYNGRSIPWSTMPLLEQHIPFRSRTPAAYERSHAACGIAAPKSERVDGYSKSPAASSPHFDRECDELDANPLLQCTRECCDGRRERPAMVGSANDEHIPRQ